MVNGNLWADFSTKWKSIPKPLRQLTANDLLTSFPRKRREVKDKASMWPRKQDRERLSPQAVSQAAAFDTGTRNCELQTPCLAAIAAPHGPFSCCFLIVSVSC